MDQHAPKTCRVTRRKDIERIFEAGRAVRDGLLTLFAVPNGLDRVRCAVGVSKCHGGAVRRNRVKRLCREAFRLSRSQIAVGWDFMIVPRPGGAITLASLRKSVSALAGRITAASRQGGGEP